jgi:alpha-tubulin suppressor-like RCC1 family protein
VQKAAAVLVGMGLLFAGLTACGPLRRQGQRCDPKTETWAHDNSHWILQCKPNGRWVRALTEAQANAFWRAVAAKQAAEKAAAAAAAKSPPPPPSPPATVILPAVPAIGSAAQRIATGLNHSCAISGSTLKCWGSNISGQLGLGSNVGATVSTTTAAASLVTDASSVAAGKNTTCAVITGGAVKCFGANEADQVGEPGGFGAAEPTPVQVPGLSGTVQVGVGDEHACALRNDGTVWCWGDDTNGKLGDGRATGTTFQPVRVIGLNGIVQIAVGNNHSCALSNLGYVFCWGANNLGQLGNGSGGPNQPAAQFAWTALPVLVFGGSALANARSISAGAYDSCATDLYGKVYCWGDNVYGEIGWGPGSQVTQPYTTLAGYPVAYIVHATSVSVGTYHVCARLNTGVVFCWGRNDSYQMGISTVGDFPFPQGVPGISGVVSLSSSVVHTCALRGDGQVLCWGTDSGGALGNRLGTGDMPGGHLAGAPVIGFP